MQVVQKIAHYKYGAYLQVKVEMCNFFFFLVWKNFIHIKKKTLQKRRQSRETKYSATKKNLKKYIYITMYNHKLYRIARLVPNKSIQAVSKS